MLGTDLGDEDCFEIEVESFEVDKEDDDEGGDDYANIEPNESVQPSQLSDCDPKLDMTSKSSLTWSKLKNGEEIKIRNRVLWSQSSGPTSYACKRITIRF